MRNIYGTEVPEQASWAHSLAAYIRPVAPMEEIPFAGMLLFWGLLIFAPAMWGATVYTGIIATIAVVMFVTWAVCALMPLPTQPTDN